LNHYNVYLLPLFSIKFRCYRRSAGRIFGPYQKYLRKPFLAMFLKQCSVLCKKQSSSAISHLKNAFRITESAKAAIFQNGGCWEHRLNRPPLLLVLLQENFENFGPSDSKSVYF